MIRVIRVLFLRRFDRSSLPCAPGSVFMAEPTDVTQSPAAAPGAITTAAVSAVNGEPGGEGAAFQPYVPPEAHPHEFTWPAVLVGTVLGIIFGASSLYLLLKVGMTVSASVPI